MTFFNQNQFLKVTNNLLFKYFATNKNQTKRQVFFIITLLTESTRIKI